MHPMQTHEIARMKIADELAYAARERRGPSRRLPIGPRWIDFSSLGQATRPRVLAADAARWSSRPRTGA